MTAFIRTCTGMLAFKRMFDNQCRFEFIALLDIDEVIIPVKHENWNKLMKDLVRMSLKVKDIFQLTCKSNSFQTDKLPRASWNFRNVFFMDAMAGKVDATENEHIPPNMPLMKNIHRQNK